ncbi:MAG: hypothetical protein ATN31_03220 [Candidatus Epulonipiscioides saccharophilum]|nr:MAG: hypothetical protein ATN31_03220 [Epulopiscium sp. AS2M-Bin001]
MTTLEEELLIKAKEIEEHGESNQRKLDSYAKTLLELAEDKNSAFAISALKDLIINPKLDFVFRMFIFLMLKRISLLPKSIAEIETGLYDYMLVDLKNYIDSTEMPFLEEEERQSNKLVIVTNQFIGIGSLETEEFAKIIQCIDKYFEQIDEVYIMNSDSLVQEIPLAQKYHVGVVLNPKVKEEIQLILNEYKIFRCKVGYEEKRELNYLDRLAYFTHYIWKLKPYRVIALGTTNILAELINSFMEVFTIAYDSQNTGQCHTQHIIVLDKEKAMKEGTMDLEEEEYYKKLLDYVLNTPK